MANGIRKLLTFVLLLGFGFGVMWMNLALPQKHWLMDKLGIAFDRSVPEDTSRSDSVLVERPTSMTTTVEEVKAAWQAWLYGPKAMANKVEQHIDPLLCQKAQTRSITEVDQGRIYRWVDDNGRVHFSDSAPKQSAVEDLSTRYASKSQYFRMHLESPEHELPPLLGEHLQRDMNAIYGFLADQLDAQWLRQVDLNLLVYNEERGFEAHRSRYAPELLGVAGFYTSLNNEAVVMRQGHDEATRAIARHEATHVINAGLFGRSPIWFNEGLAEYFETHTYVSLSNRQQPVNEYHRAFLIQEGSQGRLPTLSSYLSLSESAWRAQNAHLMYAMAWSVIYVLMQDAPGQSLLRNLLAFMAEQPCRRVEAGAFWQAHYPGGLPSFERKWRATILSSN